MRIGRIPIAPVAGLLLVLGCAAARAPAASVPEALTRGMHVDSAGGEPCPAHRQRSTFCRMFRPVSA